MRTSRHGTNYTWPRDHFHLSAMLDTVKDSGYAIGLEEGRRQSQRQVEQITNILNAMIYLSETQVRIANEARCILRDIFENSSGLIRPEARKEE